ncbi:MAG: tetratricopeptide repeat protein [Dissulfurispiraceae bacterium]
MKRKKIKTKETGIENDKSERTLFSRFTNSRCFGSTLHDSRFHIACIVLVIIIVYSNTLNAPFQWDERLHLVANPLVKDLRYFAHPSEGQWSGQYNFVMRRYIAFLTFALNYRVHGFSVTGYHIVNIAIHIANSILVYLLVLLTFRTPFMKGIEQKNEVEKLRSCEVEQFTPSQPLNFSTSGNTAGIAFFSAMLFAVHPLQTEAVTYVMQRFASLVAFFYLLSLTAYIRFRLETDNQRVMVPQKVVIPAKAGIQGISNYPKRLDSRLHGNDEKTLFQTFCNIAKVGRWSFYAITLLSAVLAMKTKENAFTLPIVIVLYEFCFFSPSPSVPASPVPPVLLSRRFLYLAPILLTLLIIPLTHTSPGDSFQLDPGSYGQIRPQPDYLLTEFRVIITYLRLLFFPINQNLDYDYPLCKSFFDPPVLLSFIFLTALFSLGVYLVKGKRQKIEVEKVGSCEVGQQPFEKFSPSQVLNLSASCGAPELRLMGFGILWFFITISVESSVIPLWMLICEYRVYMPSVGVIICAVTGAFLLGRFLLSQFTSHVPRIILIMLVLVTGVFSVAAYLRNDLWADSIRLWEDTVKKSPSDSLAHINLARQYETRNMIDKALDQYQIAIRLHPDYAPAHFLLGTLYLKFNVIDKALEQYQNAIRLKPDYADAYNNLGLIYQHSNMPDKAVEQYLIVIRLQPDCVQAHWNLGNVYRTMNMPEKAAEQYRIAVKLDPHFAEAH